MILISLIIIIFNKTILYICFLKFGSMLSSKEFNYSIKNDKGTQISYCRLTYILLLERMVISSTENCDFSQIVKFLHVLDTHTTFRRNCFKGKEGRKKFVLVQKLKYILLYFTKA